ncbi:hypothetical protein L1887_43397 [Cichorium endivia]|nr:hypothetical protein L1887_43397 [Cichorium endivia]
MPASSVCLDEKRTNMHLVVTKKQAVRWGARWARSHCISSHDSERRDTRSHDSLFARQPRCNSVYRSLERLNVATLNLLHMQILRTGICQITYARNECSLRLIIKQKSGRSIVSGVMSNSPLHDEVNTTISDNERFAISMVELREELETTRRMSGANKHTGGFGRRSFGHAVPTRACPRFVTLADDAILTLRNRHHTAVGAGKEVLSRSGVCCAVPEMRDVLATLRQFVLA